MSEHTKAEKTTITTAQAEQLFEACVFFLGSLDCRKRGGLTPHPNCEDWDTVEYVIRKAVDSVAAIAKVKGSER